jgi:Trm5-related predicted tRNA methylase
MKLVQNKRQKDFTQRVTGDPDWPIFVADLEKFYFGAWQRAEKTELREEIFREYKAFKQFCSKLEAMSFEFEGKKRETVVR